MQYTPDMTPLTTGSTSTFKTGSGDEDWELQTLSADIELVLDNPEDNLYCPVANPWQENYIDAFNLNGRLFETAETGGLINRGEPVIVNSDDNTFIIKSHNVLSSYFTNFFQIWIDLNGDYLFGNEDLQGIQPERVFHTLENDGTELINGVFEIPEEYLLPGTTHSKLRIFHSTSSWTLTLPEPCGTWEGWGGSFVEEVEDYEIKWTVIPELNLNHELNNSTLTIGNQTEYQERLLWQWNFGDGTTSNEDSPTHNFDTEGDYTIRLEVSDLDGELLDEWQVDIRVPPTNEPQPSDPDDQDSDNSGSSGIEILLLLGLIALGRRAKQA